MTVSQVSRRPLPDDSVQLSMLLNLIAHETVFRREMLFTTPVSRNRIETTTARSSCRHSRVSNRLESRLVSIL